MPEVQLSNGNVAVVKDVEDMTRGDVRAAFKLADLDGATLNQGQLGMDAVGALQDAVLTRFVTSWTLTDGNGKTLPVNMKSVRALRLRDYNPLAEACAPHLAELMSGQAQEIPDPTSEAASSQPDSTD